MRLGKKLQQYDQIVGIILIMQLILFFVVHKRNETNKNGIITVARITKFEPAESGSSLFAEVYIDEKTVSVEVNETCSNFEVGKYYFARIKKSNPKDYPVVYCDKIVPDCILNTKGYYSGWKDFPECNTSGR